MALKEWTRRAFLGAGAAAAAAAAWKSITFLIPGRRIEGSIVGPSVELGHRLRTQDFPSPTRRIDVPLAIFGGGIAALGAAWKLDQSGMNDFLMFELERTPGGTAASGRNEVSAYPWGAHYVPLPNEESASVRELFRDLGVMTETGAFDERYRCFAPHERVFADGEWQEGLFPARGASKKDLDQLRDFTAAMEKLRRRRAFRLPLELSERDPELLRWDRATMEEYLRRNGWDSPRLRWYVEYGCRDDYGCSLSTTSAWAGLHYHACRQAAHPESGLSVLTWPEGNGWIVAEMAKRLGPRIRCNHLVTRIFPEQDGVVAHVYDAVRGDVAEVRSRHAICALPRFIARHVVEPFRARPPEWLSAFSYAPWMVANLTVDRVPTGPGFEPAWDNVLYESDSLGYVVATHQSLSTARGPSVLTYYRPFPDGDPARERTKMLARSWEEWRDEILKDLGRAHPDIASLVRSIDVMLWGHGMIRPVPGFIWGEARRRAAEPLGRLLFAHSDLGGLPLFEEALHQGVSAAEAILRK